MRWKHQDPAATSQALLAFLVSSASLPTAAAAAQIVFVAWRAQGWAVKTIATKLWAVVVAHKFACICCIAICMHRYSDPKRKGIAGHG